jgi:tetratricopeptide (TPR) repeat protein
MAFNIPLKFVQWRTLALTGLLSLALSLPGIAAPTDPMTEMESIMLAQRTRPDVAQFERVRQFAETAVNKTPKDIRAWTLLIWVRMIEHRFGDALTAATRAENLTPNHPRLLMLKSDALLELGRYDEAATTAQQLTDVAPGIPAWTRVAHLRFLFNDMEGAIEIMSLAAKAGAAHGEPSAWVWLDLARLQLDASNLAAAKEAIAAAERAQPGLPATRSADARLQLAAGNARAALGLYREALNKMPSAEDALSAWRIARKLEDKGLEKHMAALLEGFAKLDLARSRRALAEYLAERGQFDRALKYARGEYADRPDLYSAATLARVLNRAGKRAEARPFAKIALALNTPDPQLTDIRAIIAAMPMDE